MMHPLLEQGDIIYLDFHPQAGHEQAGRRPALVVSNALFNQYTGLALVCPITSRERAHPLHVALDERTQVKGYVLCEQVKSLDMDARHAQRMERLPSGLLDQVLDILSGILEVSPRKP